MFLTYRVSGFRVLVSLLVFSWRFIVIRFLFFPALCRDSYSSFELCCMRRYSVLQWLVSVPMLVPAWTVNCVVPEFRLVSVYLFMY